MPKLGSTKRPCIVRVHTEEEALAALELAGRHGVHAIVGIEPDRPKDLTDLHKALGRKYDDDPATRRDLDGMVLLDTLLPDLANRETRIVATSLDASGHAKTGYAFLEFYCVDPTCDCRRVMFGVHDLATGARLATISYGFADPNGDDPDNLPELDPFNEQSERADEVLALFEDVMLHDQVFLDRLPLHYAAVRELVRAQPERRLLTRRPPVAALQARRGPPRVFVFDAALGPVLAEIDEKKWARAIREAGGVVARAAALCGVEGIAGKARAWVGRDEAEARAAGQRGGRKR